MGKITVEKFEEAYAAYKKITSDSDLMTLIINREMAEMDEAWGKRLAREAGEREAKLETAKKMLEKDMDISLIIELTGLSFEEIEELKNN